MPPPASSSKALKAKNGTPGSQSKPPSGLRAFFISTHSTPAEKQEEVIILESPEEIPNVAEKHVEKDSEIQCKVAKALFPLFSGSKKTPNEKAVIVTPESSSSDINDSLLKKEEMLVDKTDQEKPDEAATMVLEDESAHIDTPVVSAKKATGRPKKTRSLPEQPENAAEASDQVQEQEQEEEQELSGRRRSSRLRALPKYNAYYSDQEDKDDEDASDTEGEPAEDNGDTGRRGRRRSSRNRSSRDDENEEDDEENEEDEDDYYAAYSSTKKRRPPPSTQSKAAKSPRPAAIFLSRAEKQQRDAQLREQRLKEEAEERERRIQQDIQLTRMVNDSMLLQSKKTSVAPLFAARSVGSAVGKATGDKDSRAKENAAAEASETLLPAITVGLSAELLRAFSSSSDMAWPLRSSSHDTISVTSPVFSSDSCVSAVDSAADLRDLWFRYAASSTATAASAATVSSRRVTRSYADARQRLAAWLRDWKAGDSRDRRGDDYSDSDDDRSWGRGGGEDAPCSLFVLHGPAGAGKTSCVYAGVGAVKAGGGVIECNSSTVRSGAALRRLVGELGETGGGAAGGAAIKAVLLDDAEVVLEDEERSFHPAIQRLGCDGGAPLLLTLTQFPSFLLHPKLQYEYIHLPQPSLGEAVALLGGAATGSGNVQDVLLALAAAADVRAMRSLLALKHGVEHSPPLSTSAEAQESLSDWLVRRGEDWGMFDAFPSASSSDVKGSNEFRVFHPVLDSLASSSVSSGGGWMVLRGEHLLQRQFAASDNIYPVFALLDERLSLPVRLLAVDEAGVSLPPLAPGLHSLRLCISFGNSGLSLRSNAKHILVEEDNQHDGKESGGLYKYLTSGGKTWAAIKASLPSAASNAHATASSGAAGSARKKRAGYASRVKRANKSKVRGTLRLVAKKSAAPHDMEDNEDDDKEEEEEEEAADGKDSEEEWDDEDEGARGATRRRRSGRMSILDSDSDDNNEEQLDKCEEEVNEREDSGKDEDDKEEKGDAKEGTEETIQTEQSNSAIELCPLPEEPVLSELLRQAEEMDKTQPPSLCDPHLSFPVAPFVDASSLEHVWRGLDELSAGDEVWGRAVRGVGGHMLKEQEEEHDEGEDDGEGDNYASALRADFQFCTFRAHVRRYLFPHMQIGSAVGASSKARGSKGDSAVVDMTLEDSEDRGQNPSAVISLCDEQEEEVLSPGSLSQDLALLAPLPAFLRHVVRRQRHVQEVRACMWDVVGRRGGRGGDPPLTLMLEVFPYVALLARCLKRLDEEQRRARSAMLEKGWGWGDGGRRRRSREADDDDGQPGGIYAYITERVGLSAASLENVMVLTLLATSSS
eukprot:gene27175-32831_t